MRYFLWSIFQGIANWLKDGDPDYDGTRYKKFKQVEALRELLTRMQKDIERVENCPSHSVKSIAISYSGMDDNDSDFLLDYYRGAHYDARALVNQVNATLGLGD